MASRLTDLAVSPARRRDILAEHAAIASGKAVAARAAMHRHLAALRHARLAALEDG